jgi:hypothetical protein
MTGIRPQEVGNFSEQVWGVSVSADNEVDRVTYLDRDR